MNTNADRSTRWSALNAFVDHKLTLLPKGSSVAAWVVLFRHANRQNQVQMGAGRLAALLAVDRRTAQRAVDDLLAAGVIKVISHGGMRAGANTYQL